MSRAALALALLGWAGCEAPAPASAPSPPSIPGATAATTPAPLRGSMAVRTVAGRALVDGAQLASTEALVFEVTGSPGAYLGIVERAGDSLTVLAPASGWVLPAAEQPTQVVPQPTWMTDGDDELPGWLPNASGALEYLLLVSPTPRESPSGDALIGGLEQLLAAPPYLKGPAGRPAVVASRLRLERSAP